MNDDTHHDAQAATKALWPGMGSSSGGADPAPPSDATVFRLEHYTVLTRPDGSLWELGRGAMGITYKALDARLHCHVALKVIKAELLVSNPAVRERFLREARAAARLRHPNIATVFHLGETASGQAFYAMEFIEGETLAARIRRRGPLPVALALDIGLEVARALVAAKQQGLVHRDLKPANLMLVAGLEDRAKDPGSGSETGEVKVKVIDFGLAKAAAETGPLTLAGDFLGTPQFASPEQFLDNDHSTDFRSDIYSLGATLWYALTGSLPFPGRSLSEVRSRQLADELPVAQLTAAGVPVSMADLLAQMLAVDPADRPQSPYLLLDALRRCREQLQPNAPAAVPLGRRRGGGGIKTAGALAAALALLALLGGAAWLLLRSRTAPPPAPPVVEAVLPEKSIAVLPFANLSTDKDNAFFAAGVQDEILTDLAKVADLKVISRTSVMQYKSDAPRNLREIAAQLGVGNVVEGSVQRSGGKVRVTAQLINARTDTHLWAEHYDRDLSDIFAIQSEIAQTIADQLRATLSPQEKAAISAPPTTDLQAYDLFLRARQLYAESSVTQVHEKLPQAARLLDAALERDPKYLPAWCLLARVHGDRYFGGDDHTPERLEQATAAVQAAVRLQPDAGETHLALADYYYHGFRDYDRARTELDLARRTLPNNPEIYEYTGYIDRRQSRWQDATRNLQHALDLDPRNFFTLQQTGLTHLTLHRYDEVRRCWDRALAIVPTDTGGRIYRAYLEIDARADVKPFQTAFAALVAEDPRVAPYVDDPNYALCERTPASAARVLGDYPQEGSANMGAIYPHAYWEGLVARWQGDTPRAQAAFAAARAELEKVLAVQPDLAPALSILAMVDAGSGRKQEAVAEGRRACELLPGSKDALAGAVIAVNLAQTLAWVGDKTAAIEQIAMIQKGPNELSYGLLKLHPRWDDLRGDPRFEKLVAEVAAFPGY